MLTKEALATFVQRDQHARTELTGRRAANMRYTRARLLPDRPAGLANAVAPIDFFGVHKEALVEHPNLFDHGAAREDARAERVIDRERCIGALFMWIAPMPPGAVQPAGQHLAGRKQVEQCHC